MNRLIEEGRIIWPEKKDGRPRRKAFLSELNARTNVSSVIASGFYTNDGTKAFEKVMPDAAFPFPKPIELVQFILSLFERTDIRILDSFAGSGSTAHAVLDANRRDGGTRRFVLVEMEEYADATTAERVRRVIKGYPFKGKQTVELLREKITWSKFQRAQAVVSSVEGIENLHGQEYDQIKKQVKEGELIVTGEKSVDEWAEGLAGAFTYCTLGEPLELDKLLTGEALPSFHMATNRAFDLAAAREADFYLGEAGGQHVWLIYRPDLDWLKTPEAALTLSRAKAFAATDAKKRHLVFAPARYVSQKMLDEQSVPVEFVPLPFALYRIDRS
jgi:adenine-specific DNA-methyltransferase